ncbi:hypothetical protein F4825DRAFT_56909 [Nemania diffusa]|nr:hypothetical protein F4825DRAFT_56909 [Nemania diffusa]
MCHTFNFAASLILLLSNVSPLFLLHSGISEYQNPISFHIYVYRTAVLAQYIIRLMGSTHCHDFPSATPPKKKPRKRKTERKMEKETDTEQRQDRHGQTKTDAKSSFQTQQPPSRIHAVPGSTTRCVIAYTCSILHAHPVHTYYVGCPDASRTQTSQLGTAFPATEILAGTGLRKSVEVCGLRSTLPLVGRRATTLSINSVTRRPPNQQEHLQEYSNYFSGPPRECAPNVPTRRGEYSSNVAGSGEKDLR